MNAITISKFNSQDNSIIKAGYNSLSELSRIAYNNDLKTFNEIVNKDLQEVDMDDITFYIQELEKRFKQRTVNRKIFSLSKILRLYVMQGLIKFNPVEALRKINRNILSRKVSSAINTQLEFADILKVKQLNNKTSLIVDCLVSTGMRISELTGIKTDDISDYSKDGKQFKKISIIGKGKKQRDIYITLDMYNKIKAKFGKSKSGYLFQSRSGKRLNNANMYKQIKAIFKRMTGKHITPHMTRHFYCTYQIKTLKRGVDGVSKYVGHSSTAITLDMYVHGQVDLKEAILEVA